MAEEDPKPAQPDMPTPQPAEVSAKPAPRPGSTPEQRVEGARDMLDGGYTPAQVVGWMMTATPDKDWKTTRAGARIILEKALERIDGEVTAPKSRKQARTRGMLTLFARRALELSYDPKLTAKAAGFLTAGVAALDKIARIDGAYAFDASTLLPASSTVATPEEALRLIQHAAALADMAVRRGALTSAPQPPPVIDATSSDVEDDEDAEPELGVEPGDAN